MTPFETWWNERVKQPMTTPVHFRDVWDAATAAALEMIASSVREEAKAAHLPDDRWDQGYRQACANIEAIIREKGRQP